MGMGALSAGTGGPTGGADIPGVFHEPSTLSMVL